MALRGKVQSSVRLVRRAKIVATGVVTAVETGAIAHVMIGVIAAAAGIATGAAGVTAVAAGIGGKLGFSSQEIRSRESVLIPDFFL